MYKIKSHLNWVIGSVNLPFFGLNLYFALTSHGKAEPWFSLGFACFSLGAFLFNGLAIPRLLNREKSK